LDKRDHGERGTYENGVSKFITVKHHISQSDGMRGMCTALGVGKQVSREEINGEYPRARQGKKECHTCKEEKICL